MDILIKIRVFKMEDAVRSGELQRGRECEGRKRVDSTPFGR